MTSDGRVGADPRRRSRHDWRTPSGRGAMARLHSQPPPTLSLPALQARDARLSGRLALAPVADLVGQLPTS